ncbi:MAG: hypothetical protein ACXWWY_12485, partial [Candidatus Deferrimicrobiaceae bacterium]
MKRSGWPFGRAISAIFLLAAATAAAVEIAPLPHRAIEQIEGRVPDEPPPPEGTGQVPPAPPGGEETTPAAQGTPPSGVGAPAPESTPLPLPAPAAQEAPVPPVS